MAKKCKGLNAKGRLMAGFRWTKGAACPKKAKAKKAVAKKRKASRRGRSRSLTYDTGSGYSAGYERWKRGDFDPMNRPGAIADYYSESMFNGLGRHKRSRRR